MITNKTIYQVDAFISTPFKGNPAGVMIVDKWPDTSWMQNIAMEMNMSETAFILHTDNDFKIRYFNPIREVPLCGHATLASAHILYEIGLIDNKEQIKLKAEGGELLISRKSDWIVMIFPTYPLRRIETLKDFRTIIGFEPIETYASKYGWIVAIANKEEDILKANPNFSKMNVPGLDHLIITAKSDKQEIDFVSRCFAPISGINEDPVTGSAHCALTPLWSDKLSKTSMNAKQLSKRSGDLKVKLVDNQVEIMGQAITIFQAELKI